MVLNVYKNYFSSFPAFKTCQSVLNEDIVTTVDVTAKGQSGILCPGMLDSTNFNGHSGAIKTGLSHLAIPRGWSWGGPASPFCPIWAEIKVPDWQNHAKKYGNKKKLANFVSSAVLFFIQCLLVVLLQFYFNWGSTAILKRQSWRLFSCQFKVSKYIFNLCILSMILSVRYLLKRYYPIMWGFGMCTRIFKVL